MSKVKSGDTVKVHYTGTKTTGEIFDSSENREPLEFTMGTGQLIPGFEKAVEGLAVGESTKVTIPAGEAYGDKREDLVINVEKDKLPPEIKPELGQQLQIQQQDGNGIPVVITEVTESHVTLDANHPLAGEDLTFDIELVEIA